MNGHHGTLHSPFLIFFLFHLEAPDMNRAVIPSLLSACCLLLFGCSDQYAGRMAVEGNITLEGQPLSDATIIFEPLAGQDTTAGGAVAEGEYKIERKSGLKPGKYRVVITAGDGKTPASPEEAGAPGGSTNIVSVDRIPPEYSDRSQQTVEVTKDGPNKFDFVIPKAREIRRR